MHFLWKDVSFSVFTRSNEPKSVPGFETFFPSAKGMHKETSEAQYFLRACVSTARRIFLWGEGKRKRFPLNLSREDNGSNIFCPILGIDSHLNMNTL